MGDDLGAYAEHAGKMMVDETDMNALMRRCVVQSLTWIRSFGAIVLTPHTGRDCRILPIRHSPWHRDTSQGN